MLYTWNPSEIGDISSLQGFRFVTFMLLFQDLIYLELNK